MLSAENFSVLTKSRLRADGFHSKVSNLTFFSLLLQSRGYFNNEIDKLIDFALFCHFLVFWRNFHRGRLLDRGRLFEKGV